MEVYALQFLFMGIIFLLTTGVGLSPVLLQGVSKKLVSRAIIRQRIISCASCFGAGVFIFVCFMGLLPAADRKFHHFLEELGHTDENWEAFAEFPWGFFVVICGFLFIFTIDKLVHAMTQKRRGDTKPASHSLLTTKISQGSVTQSSTDTESNSLPSLGYDSESCLKDQTTGHGVPTSIIFLLALGIHSLFEGMAVGLQTQKDKVLEFSLAVLVHEVVMAFSFGLEVSSNTRLTRWGKIGYVIVFTATIPLGIAAGVGLQSAPSGNREIVSAVLEAFATGIFIHVIFIEVLAKEFPHHHHQEHHENHHHHHHTDPLDMESKPKPTSETCLILEKIACICCGIATLILLSVFMHAHH